VHWVTTASSGFAAAAEHPHDAVLVDAALADDATLHGLLEEDPRAQIILLGDPSGAEAVRSARLSGAIDHLPKLGLDADTLERAVRYAADHRRSVERLEHTAMHDALTGLPNRTLFLDRLEQSLRRARRRGAGSGGAVLFLDLDRFKEVNDRYGHEAGNEILRAVAGEIRNAVRASDVAARYGGDEFVVILTRTDLQGAARVAEALRAGIEGTGRRMGYPPGLVTVSVGIAEFDPREPAEVDLLVSADRALYRAKAAGRNAVA
jgi:diguanylate cyclase (GGDEF)-like protein